MVVKLPRTEASAYCADTLCVRRSKRVSASMPDADADAPENISAVAAVASMAVP